MVILSAAVTNKAGKACVSRQFVEMTRIRIEGLLAAFPKLIGTDGKQHTYIETESVRYLYQPIDNLFLLLVTNRASNIVEDLETLRLLSKVVPDVLGVSNNISEDRIAEKCFDLIFAFDEVITFGGYREPITLQQIRSNLEMESHEERLHNMIKQSKVESAKDQARAAATTIREKRDSAMEGIGGGGGGPMGMGGGDFNRDRGYSGSPSSFQPPSVPTPDVPSISAAPSRPAAVKGMSLMAAGGKNKSLEDALYKEDKLMPVIPKAIPSSSSGAAPPPAPTPSIVHPIMLVLNERVNCSATRDGSIESFDVKGSLTLTASDDDVALCSVQMNATQSEMFNFTTHPKVNKAVYEQNGLLQLKDTTKGFPSQRPVGILKWSHSSATEDFVPLKINCWPEEEARGQINVSIEYSMEQSLVLHNVVIRIPLGTSNPPNIISMDGMYKHNAQAGELLWTVDMIDSSNSSGSLEFSIQQRDTDAFFPINVEFSSPQLYCDLEVQQVVAAGSGAAIQYGLSKGLSTEEYTIV